MSNQVNNPSDMDLWKHYLETFDAYLDAGRTFNENVKDKVGTLKSAFRNHESRLALKLAKLLKADELQGLFAELLTLASYSHGSTGIAQELILSLPHDWLLSNIEIYSEDLIVNGDYETYWALLTLYYKIDHDLARRLAIRARKSTDEAIRDAGESYLERLQS